MLARIRAEWLSVDSAMAERRKYRNPPIVEALCEVHFKDSREWNETVPGRFYDRVQSDFPVVEEGEGRPRRPEVILRGSPGAQAEILRPPRPTRMASRNRDALVQLAQDVLVVNHLSPYRTFDERLPVVLRMLEHYRDLAQPDAVTRAGVRYINRVAFSAKGIDLASNFALYPHLPEGSRDGYEKFLLRFESRRPDGHTLTVTFASAPGAEAQSSAVMLDLYDQWIPTAPARFEEIEGQLCAARANINAAFEDSITDALRSRFEPEA